MKLPYLITVRVILGVLLVWMALPSTAYGFDTHFTSGKRSLAIPFELDHNHIYLRVSVNGSPPLSFILDTGASHTVLSLQNAKAFGLGLQPVGNVEGGIGAEPLEAYITTDNVSYSLPGVVVSDQSLIVLPLDKAQECVAPTADGETGLKVTSGQETRAGKVLAGILGKDFFGNFVVEIDYPARLINLYDPQSFRYTGRGKSFPLEMDSQHIFVRAHVKAAGHPPVTARLVVDTGSGTALSLMRQFAEKHKLLPPAEKMTVFTDCGIGGSEKEESWAGTLEALELGGFKLPNPVTVFYRKSPIASGDGLLGWPALHGFKVVFDYSRSRMILEMPRRTKSNR